MLSHIGVDQPIVRAEKPQLTLVRDNRCTATRGAHAGQFQTYACGPRCAAHKPQYIGPFGFPRTAAGAV